jgi:hypothetical protein
LKCIKVKNDLGKRRKNVKMKVNEKIFALNKIVRMSGKQVLNHFKAECSSTATATSIRAKNSEKVFTRKSYY